MPLLDHAGEEPRASLSIDLLIRFRHFCSYQPFHNLGPHPRFYHWLPPRAHDHQHRQSRSQTLVPPCVLRCRTRLVATLGIDRPRRLG